MSSVMDVDYTLAEQRRELPETSPIICQSSLGQPTLKGEVVIVTGGGRGIGYETARALLWLGANVVNAERNVEAGTESIRRLTNNLGEDRIIFVQTDVGNEADIAELAKTALASFGKVDAVINNAAVEPIGAVKDASVDDWDLSYRVNLRGPVLLARAFLPDMIRRKHGVFACVSSSGAVPYMGPYEVFKTAQVELANTLAGELEGTGVYAYTIGPGIVQTPGFMEGGSRVAKLMGITLEQLVEMNKSVLLSPEEAGTGFAASMALAKKYHGSETSSIQVLREIGIGTTRSEHSKPVRATSQDSQVLLARVIETYNEQSRGWKQRNLFQRQWVFRDFKKQTGMSVDEMGVELSRLRNSATSTDSINLLEKLAFYYKHQQELLRGFEKNREKLADNLKEIQSWIDDISNLATLVRA